MNTSFPATPTHGNSRGDFDCTTGVSAPMTTCTVRDDREERRSAEDCHAASFAPHGRRPRDDEAHRGFPRVLRGGIHRQNGSIRGRACRCRRGRRSGRREGRFRCARFGGRRRVYRGVLDARQVRSAGRNRDNRSRPSARPLKFRCTIIFCSLTERIARATKFGVKTARIASLASISILLLAAACGGKLAPEPDTTNGTNGSGNGSSGGSSGGTSGSGGGTTGTVSTSITCGATTCDDTKQDCCVDIGSGGGGGGGTAACVDKGSCANGLALSCSSSQNCASGQVCCASQDDTGAASAVCASSCGNDMQSAQLCASDKECPDGDTCQATPFGFAFCAPDGFGGGGGSGGRHRDGG